MVKSVNILGVTGSIGQSTADVIAAHPQRFDVQMICANSDVQGLAQAARRLNAKTAIIAAVDKFEELSKLLAGTKVTPLCGAAEINKHAGNQADLTVAAIVGMAGLDSLMPAIAHSKAVAIANKEPLVAAGEIVIEAAQKHGTTILPIDSEHNAVFQIFDEKNKNEINRIVLTASGGPFLSRDLSTFNSITPEEAVKHPNWSMGAKISVDSATMMNKALEVIEAYYLFDLEPEQIEVLIHPQSVVHGMVEYVDGSVLCQMGASDMRTPIARILDYPSRLKTPGQNLDLKALSTLDFMPVDARRFPALGLAYACLSKPDYECMAACAALNAANEIAVEYFLAHRISFPDILRIVTHIVSDADYPDLKTVSDVCSWDQYIRRETIAVIDANEISKEGKYA